MDSRYFDERLQEIAGALAASLREGIVSGDKQTLIDAMVRARGALTDVEHEAFEAQRMYQEIATQLQRLDDDGGD